MAIWLLACCIMIFAMIVIGGVTRLSQAGLSMVQWKPLVGIIPPLSQAEWQELFRQYQKFPEFQLLNFGMVIDEFKTIFWIEYFHRLVGRLIGIVFLVPFLYFLIKGWVKRPLSIHFAVIFILGGLQGVLGWYMVKSGLNQEPMVSPYRLAAHLLGAFAVYAYAFWLALGLLMPKPDAAMDRTVARIRRLNWLVVAMVVVTISTGAFVAGWHAGLTYNTFPLMDGHLIPEGLLADEPIWLNFFENITTVQFDHRWIAIATAALILYLWWRARTVVLTDHARLLSHGLAAMALIQPALGIATLVLVVPIPLAATHQAGALVLFTFALALAHALRPRY